MAFHLTEGQASDSRSLEVLLEIGPDVTPRAAVGDKGYDSRPHRTAARSRGICPAVPYKSTAKHRPTFFPKLLYRGRARIEQTVGKLKRFKRVALRCEKTVQNYESIVALALAFIPVKSVHTASAESIVHSLKASRPASEATFKPLNSNLRRRSKLHARKALSCYTRCVDPPEAPARQLFC